MNFSAQINNSTFTAKLSGPAIVSSLLRACGGGGLSATEPSAAAADAVVTPAPGSAPAACAAASVSWSVNGNTRNATTTMSAFGGNSSAKDISSPTTGSAAFGDNHAR